MSLNKFASQRLPMLILLLLMLAGCNQHRTVAPQNHHLNCILMGNDSVILYYGDGKKMEQLKAGHLQDSVFMNDIFSTIKSIPADTSFKIRIKPTASGDLAEDFTTLVDMLNDHDVQGRSVDTLYPLEQRTFFVTSPAQLIESKNNPVQPFHLMPDTHSPPGEPATSTTFTLFLSGEDILYGFLGKDMQNGQTYSTESLTTFLLANKGTANFEVRLRASVRSSYKTAVDILDVMQQHGIDKYSLEEMTKDQERFLNIKMQQSK